MEGNLLIRFEKKKRKALREKEKLLVTSNISFYLDVFMNLYNSNFGMLI